MRGPIATSHASTGVLNYLSYTSDEQQMLRHVALF